MHIAYQIMADDVDVTAAFRDRLISLTINDEAGIKSDTAEVVIDDRDSRVALPATGAALQIALGYRDTGLISMGRYVVDEISGDIGPDTMTIKAKAADMLGSIRAPKTRAWHAVTLGDVVAKIASEHGLKPAVTDDLKGVEYPFIAQTAESDLNLLTRLARDLDAIVKPAGGALVFVGRGAGKAAGGTSLPVYQIDRSQISGADWKMTGRGAYASAVAHWADIASGRTNSVTAGSGAPALTLRHTYATAAEARQAAKSALEVTARATGSININCGGFRGDLTAGGLVNLTGLRPELRGQWHITKVRHQLTGSLITRISAERKKEGQ